MEEWSCDYNLPNGSNAMSVFVSGSDVYVAGYQFTPNSSFSNNTTARLWKNGQSVTLPFIAIGTNVANAVFVSGSDVYVVGVNGITPVLWKNAVLTVLTQPKNSF